MTTQSKTSAQTVQTQAKEATPPREKLPKNFKLPKSMKGPWFASMAKSEQRSFMLAFVSGETRARNASKRDIEQYAESPQNRNVGRASVAI